MGLWTSHGCWEGAYSAFSRWRNAVAEAAGYKIVTPTEGPPPHLPGPDLPWDLYAPENYMGEWHGETPEDPLLVLLVHSDCDGIIKAEHTLHLAERLEQIAPKLPEEGAGHIKSFRGDTVQFAEGLRKAHAAGEDVEFG